MATITKSQYHKRGFGDVPYGNLSHIAAQLKTNASGAALGSDSTAAVANGDKVKLVLLPAGLTMLEMLLIVSVAFTALVTCKLGFEYADGVDSTNVPQDDDYFGTGITLHTAGVYRKSAATAPVTLPKDAWLILTTAGADNAKAAQADVSVIGELTGNP